MSRAKDKCHPGAKMFSSALESIKTKKNIHVPKKGAKFSDESTKDSIKQQDIPEVPVLVPTRSCLVLVENQMHLLQEVDDVYEKTTASDDPECEDYTLPVTLNRPPPGFNSPPALNLDCYSTSTPFNYGESSVYHSNNVTSASLANQGVDLSPIIDHSLNLTSHSSSNCQYFTSTMVPSSKSPSFCHQSTISTDSQMHSLDGSLMELMNPLSSFIDQSAHSLDCNSSTYHSLTSSIVQSSNSSLRCTNPPGSSAHSIKGSSMVYSSPSKFVGSSVYVSVSQYPSASLGTDPADIYAFSVSALATDEGDSERTVNSIPSIDYSLPIKKVSKDSGCLSEEGSYNETLSTDFSLPLSPTFNHPESTCKVVSSTEAEHTEEETKVKTEQVISGRVSRRPMSRLQGSRSSLSNVDQSKRATFHQRKSLPAVFPQYVYLDISDDSGADLSADDVTGCKGCEIESLSLVESSETRQWRPLPDYARLDFLKCTADPGFIDSHCHLDFLFQRQNYVGTYADYMLQHRDTYPVSYEGCVAVFCNPFTFSRKSLWQKYINETNVWGTFGCHPHNANNYSDLIENDLINALLHDKVCALGEIGLDYSNRNDCSKERQKLVLRRQLKIALCKKLPLVIHCRDANEDLMAILKEIVPRNHPIHLHCFTDNWSWAQKWMSAFPKLFIGITNLVTYNSAEPTHEVVKKIPLDRLLLETDAPYFVPRRSPRSIHYSHPGMAIHVAAQIATLRSISLKEIIHRTRQNTRNLYGI